MKLNNKRTILVGLAFLSICAFWQMYNSVIPKILTYTFHLDETYSGVIMAADNVLALFLLPLFGAISDRCRSRMGRRMPFILCGTGCAVLLMMLLPILDNSYAAHPTVTKLVLFIAVLGLLLIAMGTYRSPAVALMPDVPPKPLRSRANAIINLVGYVGGIFSTVMMMLLLQSEKAPDGSSYYPPDQSFTPIFLVVAGVMVLSVLILVLTTRENKLVEQTREEVAAWEHSGADAVQTKSGKLPAPQKKSLILILLSVFLWYTAYNAVTTAFSRYCVAVWGVDLSVSSGFLMAATVAAIAAFLPLGALSGRVGRKKTVQLGILLMTGCYAAAIFLTHRTPLMYLLFALVGIGWAAINVNSFPMVVEMSSQGDTGKYTGYYYAFSMAAQIFTPLLSGLLIDKAGLGYRVLFPYAVVFSLLSLCTISQVKHGDSKPLPKKDKLEAFDVGD